MTPQTGAERVAHHGNTLPCDDAKNLACDSTAGPDDEPNVRYEMSRRSDAYKAGRYDFDATALDQDRFEKDGDYAAGAADRAEEVREEEDRCSNGCVCTALDKMNADNPEVSVSSDQEAGENPYPKERILVAFTVRRSFDAQPTEPEQFLQYLVEMLELPQIIEEDRPDYWVTGADVYGVES